MSDKRNKFYGTYLRREGTCRVECSRGTETKCGLCYKIIELFRVRDFARANEPYIWYHWNCFLGLSQQNKCIQLRDIDNLDALRLEDQLRITDKVFLNQQWYNHLKSRQRVKFIDQSNKLYEYMDALKTMRMEELDEVMIENDIRVGNEMALNTKLNIVADAMTFGVPELCPKCVKLYNNGKAGQLMFRRCAYVCVRGAEAPTVECNYWTKAPKRSPLVIPKYLTLKYKFLRKYQKKSKDLNERIYLTFLNRDIENSYKQWKAREKVDKPVVKVTNTVPRKKCLNKTVTIKEGVELEPNPKLGENRRVFRDNSGPYSAVLIRTRLSSNVNDYFKIQIHQNKHKSNMYYLHKSRGCVGYKPSVPPECVLMKSREEAINEFREEFRYKCGYEWEYRYKVNERKPDSPEYYSFLDINYLTKLHDNLIQLFAPKYAEDGKDPLIRQLHTYKNMVPLIDWKVKLDVKYFPLGIPSDDVIELAELLLQKLLKMSEECVSTTYDDLSPQFLHHIQSYYQKIPRQSSAENPLPVLSTKESITDEMKRLEAIKEYKLQFIPCRRIRGHKPLKLLRDNLKATINPVEVNSEEFTAITQYITQSDGHGHKGRQKYLNFQVDKVYRVGNPSAKQSIGRSTVALLHGTDKSNLIDIMNHGIKIGDRYYKSFFADSAAKSDGYVSVDGSTKFLLLCSIPDDKIKDFDSKADYEKWLDLNGNTFPPGVSVVHIVGRYGTEGEYCKVAGGAKVPGYKKPNEGTKCFEHNGKKVVYDEFIVVNPTDVEVLYLVEYRYYKPYKPENPEKPENLALKEPEKYLETM